MSDSSESIFVKINSAEKKRSILEGILEDKKELLVKSMQNSDNVYILQAVSLVRNQLSCRAEKPFPASEKLDSVIVQFSVGEDKFLCTAKSQIPAPDSITIDLSGDIFQLHRREDFRMRLPVSYKAQFHLKKKNSKDVKAVLSILDLSAGGCRVRAPLHNLDLKMGDVLEGGMQLSRREQIPLSTTVKHLVPDPEDENLVMAGIQFKDVGAIAKNRLQALVLDVYKELFSRL
jgi:hypothetical protein